MDGELIRMDGEQSLPDSPIAAIKPALPQSREKGAAWVLKH